MSSAQDIFDRMDQRREQGRIFAERNRTELERNINKCQQSHFIRNMIKALEIHPWQNTVEDWQRYYEGKMILKMRGGRRRRK